MIRLLTPDFCYQDNRGMICQLVSNGWKQFNVLTTKAGSRRGRMHYHTKNTEAFYIVSGRIDYRCKSLESDIIEQHTFIAGDFWCVDPYIGHDFYFLEDTIHVSLYTLGVDFPDGTRDIIEMDEA